MRVIVVRFNAHVAHVRHNLLERFDSSACLCLFIEHPSHIIRSTAPARSINVVTQIFTHPSSHLLMGHLLQHRLIQVCESKMPAHQGISVILPSISSSISLATTSDIEDLSVSSTTRCDPLKYPSSACQHPMERPDADWSGCLYREDVQASVQECGDFNL